MRIVLMSLKYAIIYILMAVLTSFPETAMYGLAVLCVFVVVLISDYQSNSFDSFETTLRKSIVEYCNTFIETLSVTDEYLVNQQVIEEKDKTLVLDTTRHPVFNCEKYIVNLRSRQKEDQDNKEYDFVNYHDIFVEYFKPFYLEWKSGFIEKLENKKLLKRLEKLNLEACQFAKTIKAKRITKQEFYKSFNNVLQAMEEVCKNIKGNHKDLLSLYKPGKF